MIKFKSFKADDEKGINKFLEKHSDGMANDGVAYVEGTICFMYQDPIPTEEDGHKKYLLAALKEFVRQREQELIGTDMDEQYYRMMSITYPEKEWPQKAQETAGRKKNLMKQIQIGAAIKAKIEKGTWFDDMKG